MSPLNHSRFTSHFDDHFILVFNGFQHDPVIVAHFGQLHQHAFGLHREDIAAFDDEHVVRAPGDPVKTAVTATARAMAWKKTCQVARAVAITGMA